MKNFWKWFIRIIFTPIWVPITLACIIIFGAMLVVYIIAQLIGVTLFLQFFKCLIELGIDGETKWSWKFGFD